MTYAPTVWIDDTTPVDATRMNKIEAGLVAAVETDEVTVAGATLISTKLLVADAEPAFRIMGDGKQEWGAGGATTPDVSLYRYSANILGLDDRLLVNRGVVTDVALDARINAEASARFQVEAGGTIRWGPGGGVNLDASLYRLNAGLLGATAGISYALAAATDRFIYAAQSGDANARFTARADGLLAWGPGTGGTDTTLYRVSPAGLKTDGAFYTGKEIYAGLNQAADTVILWTNVTGDAQFRFAMFNTGRMEWSGGAGARDVNLYRSQADVLRTDDAFEARGYLYGGHNGTTYMLQVGTGGVGFNGTAAQVKQNVTGSRGGNAALTSLLTALAAIGLITNSTSA